MVDNENRLLAMLSDLGRSTLRGIRKCPNCGIYNGTRGMNCKNKECGYSFSKEGNGKTKSSIEQVCKLETGSSTQVFSVRVREKGPESRGFVQLPVSIGPAKSCDESLLPVSGSSANNCDESLLPISVSSAKNCDEAVLPVSLSSANSCDEALLPVSVSLANSCDEALIPVSVSSASICDESLLPVSVSSANSCDEALLPVSVSSADSCDEALPQLSALCFVESCHRLFQSNILKCHDKIEPLATCSHIEAALQCKVSSQPLAINESILSALDAPQDMIQELLRMCSDGGAALVQRVSRNTFAVRCRQTTKHLPGFVHVSFHHSKTPHSFSCHCMPRSWRTGDSSDKKCIHYYACLAAFCTDLKLSDTHLMQCMPPLAPTVDVIGEVIPGMLSSGGENHLLDQSVTNSQFLLDDISLFKELNDEPVELTADSSVLALSSLLTQPAKKVPKRKRESKPGGCRKQVKTTAKHSFILSHECADPSTASQSFLQWLASVTERINQAMHFQFDGKPEPLVFHIPHVFFDCLMKRFMVGSRRRRLPNLVTRFTRRQSPPLGTFFNYTWHVTNILHAKAIFDTPNMQLNITRSFVVNSDGSYDDLEASVGVEDHCSQTKVHPTIRPTELKTYLKIGRTAADQVSPSMLSLDWTPNVLPISKIGELKITFEYGHTPNLA